MSAGQGCSMPAGPCHRNGWKSMHGPFRLPWRTEMYPVTCRILLSSMPMPNLTVTVIISLDRPSSTVIVLSQIDDRYFKGINGRSEWSFDFILSKQGGSQHLLRSPNSLGRSVNVEVDLEAGDYVVQVSTIGSIIFPLIHTNVVFVKVRLDRKYVRKEVSSISFRLAR
jgi:hypothetical protein